MLLGVKIPHFDVNGAEVFVTLPNDKPADVMAAMYCDVTWDVDGAYVDPKVSVYTRRSAWNHP